MKIRIRFLGVVVGLFILMTSMTAFANTDGGVTTEEELRTAISEAQSGDTISIGASFEVAVTIEITKDLTIEGNNYTLTGNSSSSSNYRQGIFHVTAAEVTLEVNDLSIYNKNDSGNNWSNPCGISVMASDVTVTLDNVDIEAGHYAVLIGVPSSTEDEVNDVVLNVVNGSELTGFAAVYYRTNSFTNMITDPVLYVENSTLIGQGKNGTSNDFGAIVFNGTVGATANIVNSTIKNDFTVGDACMESLIQFNSWAALAVDTTVTIENSTLQTMNSDVMPNIIAYSCSQNMTEEANNKVIIDDDTEIIDEAGNDLILVIRNENELIATGVDLGDVLEDSETNEISGQQTGYVAPEVASVELVQSGDTILISEDLGSDSARTVVNITKGITISGVVDEDGNKPSIWSSTQDNGIFEVLTNEQVVIENFYLYVDNRAISVYHDAETANDAEQNADIVVLNCDVEVYNGAVGLISASEGSGGPAYSLLVDGCNFIGDFTKVVQIYLGEGDTFTFTNNTLSGSEDTNTANAMTIVPTHEDTTITITGNTFENYNRILCVDHAESDSDWTFKDNVMIDVNYALNYDSTNEYNTLDMSENFFGTTVDAEGTTVGLLDEVTVADDSNITVYPYYYESELINLIDKPRTVELSFEEISIYLGKSATIEAEVGPDNAYDKSVSWSSSDESVATVNEEGLIQATGVGTAIITATVKEDTSLVATCAVTVKKEAVVEIEASSTEDIVYGNSVTITTTVQGTDNETLEGTVVIYNDGVELVTVELVNNVVTYVLEGLEVGTHNITAIFIPSDGSDYAEAESEALEIVIIANEIVTSVVHDSDEFGIMVEMGDILANEFTEEELASGEELSVVLTVEPLELDAIDSEELVAIEELIAGLEEGIEIGLVLDIDVTKYVGTTAIALTELSDEITITIDVPEDMRGEDKEFVIIRVHNGVAELLVDIDDNPDTITFKTHLFSTYAIAEVIASVDEPEENDDEAEVEEDDEAEVEEDEAEVEEDEAEVEEDEAEVETDSEAVETGDTNNILVVWTLALTSLLGMIIISKKRFIKA